MREETFEKRRDASRTGPRPSETMRSMAPKLGVWRLRVASSATTPAERAASKTSRASRSFDANDFSTSTCLPPEMSLSACAACNALGLAI